MEVRYSVLAKEFGGHVHWKIAAVFSGLDPDVKGTDGGVHPCIADAANTNTIRIFHPCLHKGPDHLYATKNWFWEFQGVLASRKAVYADRRAAADNMNVMFHNKKYFSQSYTSHGPFSKFWQGLPTFGNLGKNTCRRSRHKKSSHPTLERLLSTFRLQ